LKQFTIQLFYFTIDYKITKFVKTHNFLKIKLPHLSSILTAFCFIPLLSFSQGYQVNLQGQAQQGMASAGTAFIQDAASVFYNPGGMSFLDKSQVIGGGTPTFSNSLFTEAETGEYGRTTSPVGTPFAAYGVYKLSDSSKLSFGLGIYTPFGSTVEWQEGWVGRFAVTRLQLMSIFVQPTISYKLTDAIGVGAGFVYSYGKVNLQKDLPLQFQNGDYGSVELDGTGSGFGFNAGIYFEPVKWFSAGFTYRSQVNMNLNKGTATFTVPSSLEENFPSGSFTSSLPLPSVTTLGISIRPNDKLTLALDINHVGWVAYDTLAFDYEVNTESLEDTKSPRNYENTFAFRLGAQYDFTEKIAARAGLSYGISPVSNGYVTPETPDANRVSYTVGVGYAIKERLKLDVSLLYTQVTRTDKNIETNLEGTFKVIAFAPGISISYIFK
jgi:long-chain fatty acid transport protein